MVLWKRSNLHKMPIRQYLLLLGSSNGSSEPWSEQTAYVRTWIRWLLSSLSEGCRSWSMGHGNQKQEYCGCSQYTVSGSKERRKLREKHKLQTALFWAGICTCNGTVFRKFQWILETEPHILQCSGRIYLGLGRPVTCNHKRRRKDILGLRWRLDGCELQCRCILCKRCSVCRPHTVRKSRTDALRSSAGELLSWKRRCESNRWNDQSKSRKWTGKQHPWELQYHLEPEKRRWRDRNKDHLLKYTGYGRRNLWRRSDHDRSAESKTADRRYLHAGVLRAE